MQPQARRQIVSTWCFSWALHGVKACAQRKRRGAASKFKVGAKAVLGKRAQKWEPIVTGSHVFVVAALPKNPYMRPQARRQIVSIWRSPWALPGVKALAQRNYMNIFNYVLLYSHLISSGIIIQI